MKFTFMSERLAQTTDGRDNYLISICSSKVPKPQFTYPWKDILRVEFDDLCPQECRSMGREDLLKDAKLFSRQDAIDILQFVAKNNDADFIIHCKQGVSRSAAVALFLAEKFGEIGNSKEYLDNHCRPNPHVTKILNEVYEELFNE